MESKIKKSMEIESGIQIYHKLRRNRSERFIVPRYSRNHL